MTDKITFIPFPNLSTGRIMLRQLTANDENEILRIRSDERISKFLLRTKYKTIAEAREFINRINTGINNGEWVYWGITLKNEEGALQANKVIGTICLWNIQKEHSRAEIGFELHPDFQGRGIMQEALNIVLDYGFNNMKLHSIEGNVNPNNFSSIKLLEKNNFVREAYFKENVYHDGKFLDSVIYSLLNHHDLK